MDAIAELVMTVRLADPAGAFAALPANARTVVVPVPVQFTSPVALTLPTWESSTSQLDTAPTTSAPLTSNALAVNCIVAPSRQFADGGVTTTVVTVAGAATHCSDASAVRLVPDEFAGPTACTVTVPAATHVARPPVDVI